MDFLEELTEKRGQITNGGNPINFIELAGGTEVPMNFNEPDAETSRDGYYYNTRLNILFKKVVIFNPTCCCRKSFYWKAVSSCT